MCGDRLEDANLEVVTDCAKGKFADHLSSGDKGALHPLLTPFFVFISVNYDSPIYTFTMITIAVITRAPPAYIPS